MGDEGRDKDRRVKKSRRKGGASSYSGPERRGTKYRRSGKKRRKKD